MCQILSRSDNLCARHLPPNLVDFVHSVTNRQTYKQKTVNDKVFTYRVVTVSIVVKLQGSVAMQLRRGGIFNDHFTKNLLPSLLVKKFFLISEQLVKFQARFIVTSPVCLATVLLKDKQLVRDLMTDRTTCNCLPAALRAAQTCRYLVYS